jgi:hypothetical protein
MGADFQNCLIVRVIAKYYHSVQLLSQNRLKRRSRSLCCSRKSMYFILPNHRHNLLEVLHSYFKIIHGVDQESECQQSFLLTEESFSTKKYHIRFSACCNHAFTSEGPTWPWFLYLSTSDKLEFGSPSLSKPVGKRF